METPIISLVCIGILIVGVATMAVSSFQAASTVTEALKEMEEQATDIRQTEIDTSEWESNTVCAVAYQGVDADGFLKTVQIASDGQITDPVIDALEFDTTNGELPSTIHVSGDVYAVAYQGGGDDGFLKTVEIVAGGQITEPVIDTLEFDTADGLEPNIIHVSGDVYAIAYQGGGADGTLKTVEIATSGQITDPVIDTLEFDTASSQVPNIIHVSGDVYAIAYQGGGDDGFLKTVEIAANGQITDPVIDTLEFDTSSGQTPNIIHVSGDVYAIAYRGDGADGFLKTVEIATNGQITDPVIDTLEFDTADGLEPNIIHVSGNVYAIAYRGVDDDGFLTTVVIATDGQIADTVVDTLEFDTFNGLEPNIIQVSGNVYAIAYRGPGDGGFLKTVEIATNGQITDGAVDTLMFDYINGLEPSMVFVSGNVLGDISLRVTNEGHTNLAQFAKWDVIAQYETGGTEYLVHLEYTTDNPPGNNQWTVEGLYLPDDEPEIWDPNVLNPDEQMKMIIKLDPDVNEGEAIRITVSTPNGVTSQSIIYRR